MVIGVKIKHTQKTLSQKIDGYGYAESTTRCIDKECDIMIRIIGRSHTEEWIYCSVCQKKQVWMRAEPDFTKRLPGTYLALCANCRRQLKKYGNSIKQTLLF
jgi:hypothetical protein